MTVRTGWMAVGVLVVLLCVGSLALADGDANAARVDRKPAARQSWLREVVVTATRSEIEGIEAPYMVDRVALGEFSSNRQPRSLPEALGETPGVMVQKTANGHGSPYIRGFTSFRTLLMLDGVRLNNSVYRPGPNQYWNTVDPYVIDRLEVVKGPGSVLYGSDAIGGAVNAITRGWLGWGEGFQQERRLIYRYASAERSHSVRAEYAASWGNELAILVGGTFKHFGDVDGGRFVGPQEHTGYDEWTGDVKILYRMSPHDELTFAFYDLSQDDVWRTHKTVHGLAWRGTTVGSELQRVFDQDHTVSYLRYRRKDIGGFLDEFQVTGSYQYTGEHRKRLRADGRRDHQGFDVHTLGLSAQFVSPSPIGKWTYGAEWYHDCVHSFQRSYAADGSFASEGIQGPVGDDASYDLIGAFVQNEMPIGERAMLTLGGRYTYARAKANNVENPDTGADMAVNDSWDALVGSARLRWFVDPEERVALFGGVSQGFRAPNLSDVARHDSARSGEFEIPAPGLDPERYITGEAGVKVDWDRFSGQVGYYYTCIDDMILRTPTGNVVGGETEVTKKNVGEGFVHGVEFTGKVQVHDEWAVFGDFTWLYGETSTFPTAAPIKRDEPLSRLMPPTGRVGVRWEHPDGDLWAEAVWTIVGKADELNTRDQGDTQRIPPGGTPGYDVIDIRGGWRVNKNVNVWAGVDNVTNRDYRIHGSGVNQPGANLKIGMEVKF
jgi:hemoglobin/transferrin/lactoferrin receptor protein